MLKVILPLLFASCFFLPAGCKKENANTSINELLLSNSKWKVFETTYQFTDTAFSFRDYIDGGFYLDLNRNGEFTQTYYPYVCAIDGKWSYSDTDKKLVLEYEGGGQAVLSYDITELTRNRLVISRPDAVLFTPGVGTAIYELHPY